MKPSTSLPTAATANVVRLPHRPEAVAVARHRLRGAMADAGLPESVQEDAEVVVSELLGNAIRYARAIAGGVLVLGWQIRDTHLEVRVTDGGSGRLVEAQAPSPTAVHGRGLHIVERLASAWGVTDHAGGLRTVWASLPMDASHSLRLVR
jgi:serine/threonine-protein kinase RsbW